MLECLIGAFGGIFIGATGVGAGSIITPLLILLGYSPAQAVSSGFLVLIMAKSVGSAIHLKMGHWPGKGGIAVLFGGLVGVSIAAMALAHFSTAPAEMNLLIRRLLGVTLVVASAAGFFSSADKSAQVEREAPSLLLVAAGAVVGALVCVTSAGSGALLLLLLIPMTSWGVAQMAALSNVFGLLVGSASLAAFSRFTTLDWSLFAKVGIGILPGVLLGVAGSRRIERRYFKIVFNSLAILLGVSLLLA